MEPWERLQALKGLDGCAEHGARLDIPPIRDEPLGVLQRRNRKPEGHSDLSKSLLGCDERGFSAVRIAPEVRNPRPKPKRRGTQIWWSFSWPETIDNTKQFVHPRQVLQG